MRGIKFRAWDKSCNKMRGINGLQDLFSLRSDGVTNDDFFLMQFTGLSDKNGKEIYEGDILVKVETDYEKWQQLDYEGEEPLKRHKKDVATMDRFPRYWLKNESFGYEGKDLENEKEWEIVGNIHENPELLN